MKYLSYLLNSVFIWTVVLLVEGGSNQWVLVSICLESVCKGKMPCWYFNTLVFN